MKKIAKQYYMELAIFCAHYHSRQTSRGYRLLCRLLGLHGGFSFHMEQECEES